MNWPKRSRVSESSPTLKYRFRKRFGSSSKEAFANVKQALIDLVESGAASKPDFIAIDANPLSQMFKAKILSLYFPKRYLAVCSGEHLEMLGEMLGFALNLPASEYQNLLIKAKQSDPITRRWSEPKFAKRVYVNAEMIPSAYEVRFDRRKFSSEE